MQKPRKTESSGVDLVVSHIQRRNFHTVPEMYPKGLWCKTHFGALLHRPTLPRLGFIA